MMLASSSQFFSGIPVRDFLKRYSYVPSKVDLQIALSIIFEMDSASLDARNQSHLTHSTGIDHQIRFVLKDRVEKSLKRLALDFRFKNKKINRVAVSLNEDDYVSIEFFKLFPEIQIQFRRLGEENLNLLSAKEIDVLCEIEKDNSNEELVLRKAQERIYVGDYSTAYKLLSHISKKSEREEVHYMLGLCTNFFGKTLESEGHFSKLLVSANPLNKVKACYVISMLYLRMHPKELQSLEKAEALLESAYLVLLENPKVEDHTFHQVFNRNGFALCLYRRGRIAEALEMLEQGILKLQKDSSGASDLHQSVLVYNAVQCLRALRKYEACEDKCLQLLEMDPLFPEYWLELSRVLLEQGKYVNAIEALNKSIVLDDLIPEAYALLGYAYLELNQLEISARHYRSAAILNPAEMQWLLDLAYCLSELKQWAEMNDILNKVNQASLNSLQRESLKALQQEMELAL